MSDANEKDWSGKSGRPGGKPGMTRGASVVSGLSAHDQIDCNTGINTHGQGQRPKTIEYGKMSHGGRSFTTK